MKILLPAWVRRGRFCFDCDRRTWREHRHSDARLDELMNEEWRS